MAALMLIVSAILAAVFHSGPIAGLVAALGFAFLAVASRIHPVFRGLAFTWWVMVAVSLALSFPAFFVKIGPVKGQQLIVPLLQVIMFGMGTTMSLGDFAGIVRTPKAVLAGLVCQFTLMPLIGWVLASSLGFPPEIAAGILLVGTSPSGLASNVMAYLAKANLALSITLTACATLLAPILTPLLMKTLAGTFIEINTGKMMLDILYMVILPVIAGLSVHYLLKGKRALLDKVLPTLSMLAIILIIAVITALGRDNLLKIGPLLIVACLIHNLFGYLLGYWSARALGLDERSSRTVSLEVGLQNSGLASGIAVSLGKAATLGLAPAVFGPLMNMTGSALANWWRDREPDFSPNETPYLT